MTHTDRGDASTLRVGGFVPFTAIDYPGHLAAVVFCQGCPWRCTYCHNPHLLPARSSGEVPWSAVAAHLARRRGLLDAVVFSGGEPTLQTGLAAAMHEAKTMGYRIGLHTAGIYPKRLARLLPLLDWVGMDVKAPLEDYERVTQRRASDLPVRESIELLLASRVACQFRTTVDPHVLTRERLDTLAAELERLGVARHVLQACR